MRRWLSCVIVILLVLTLLTIAASANTSDGVYKINTLVTDDESYIATVATTTGALNLRAEPDKSAKSLAKISDGTKVLVTNLVVDSEAEWTEISYKNQTGYVMTKYLEIVTVLPYSPITSDQKGDEVMAFKRAMRQLGYIKSEDVNQKYDDAMEKALTKLQLMNGLILEPNVVTPKLQAMIAWGMIVKCKSGYLDTATDDESGLTVSLYVWDVSGKMYDMEEAVNVKLAYGTQAAGGFPPYTITVRKTLSSGGPENADPAPNPFNQMWRKTTERLYIYATVTDAAGRSVTACVPYKYSLPPKYFDDSHG
ncbi:hypothetical protein AGMMS49992_02320 [Clostridia bacterium]|nr:hypothetical protein AGMMS49992_02320 [Clostridia bacterium]